MSAEPIDGAGGNRAFPGPTKVAEDGAFELRALFGPVVLRTSTGVPSGYSLKAIRYRGRDIADTAVEFDGDPAHTVEVVLTSRTAELSGQAIGVSGAPAAGVSIIYFPVDGARWKGFRAPGIKTSDTGRYRIPQLVAGDYFVAAVPTRDQPVLDLPDDYERLATVAERITVLESERRTADLPGDTDSPSEKATVILWLALLAPAAAAAGATAGTRLPRVSVRGRVLDSLTGAPIAGAIVETSMAGGQPLKRIEAAANGDFQLRRPAPRRLADRDSPTASGDAHPTRVQPDPSTRADVVIHLEPALAFAGRVVNEYDEAMAGVRVIAEPVEPPGGVSTPRVSRQHFTDDRGLFRLFGLAAGRYRVCAVPERRGGASMYGKTCHPGEAAALDLRHDASTPEVLIPLRRVRPTRPVQAEGDDPDSRVAIRGRVVDEQSRAGLARALVWLEPESGGERQEAIADERGRFEIRVPPGPYNLAATAGEFKATHTTHRRELLVMAGDTFAESEISLSRAGALSGVVLKDRDTPLADVVVEFSPEGTQVPVSFDHRPTTDDLGRFRVHGVRAGRYTVCAKPPTSRQADAGNWMYSRAWTPFLVRLGAPEGELLRIPLERLGAFSISGRIVGTGGDTPAPASVAVTRTSDVTFRMSTVPVGEDGSFAAGGLIPGIYTVTAYANLRFPERQPGLPLQWASSRVEIVDGDVADVILQMSEGTSVHGRVAMQGVGNERSLKGIEVRAVPVQGGSRPPSAPPVETDEEGSFVLRGVFGANVVRVGAPQGYAVRSIRYAGRDITDAPASFDGDAGHSVEILLAPSNAELTGRVLDDLGRPADDAGVLYFPADPERWKAYDGGLRQQSIGGRYRIDKITAGDYLVIAVRGPRPGWTEKDYAALAPLAERITLVDGERRVVDLRVVTLGR